MERKLILKNKISQIERLNQEVESIGNEWGIKPETMFSLNLVLEELFIIFHTGMEGLKSDFEFEFIFTDSDTYLKIDIHAAGKKFNPLTIETAPGLKSKRISGGREIGNLGIDFVIQNISSAVYQRKKGLNILSITRNY